MTIAAATAVAKPSAETSARARYGHSASAACLKRIAAPYAMSSMLRRCAKADLS
jgi:hypothetical protein